MIKRENLYWVYRSRDVKRRLRKNYRKYIDVLVIYVEIIVSLYNIKKIY